jgi:hypothetical protein
MRENNVMKYEPAADAAQSQLKGLRDQKKVATEKGNREKVIMLEKKIKEVMLKLNNRFEMIGGAK